MKSFLQNLSLMLGIHSNFGHVNGLGPSSKMTCVNGTKDLLNGSPTKILLGPPPKWSVIHEVFRDIIQIVCFAFTLALLIILSPVLLIFRLYRQTLHYIIKRRLGDAVMPCSGSDSLWLQDTPENRAIINAVLEINGKPDVEFYRQAISERLVQAKDPDDPRQHLYPKLTKYPCKILHRYVWVEEEAFDIKDHVFVHPAPAPGDKRGLEELVSDLCTKPLPIKSSEGKKSPWEFIILKDASPDSKTYHVVFRSHHSIADGISLVRVLMQSIVDKVPKTGLPMRYSAKNRMLRNIYAAFSGPYILLQRVLRSADRSILHGAKLSGRKVVTWSEKLDLELIKKIKNASGTTVNDVLVACLTGAFRDYFRDQGDSIPARIFCYLPVDLRPPAGKLVMDNQFSLVFLQLPLEQENLVDMLGKTKHRMDHVKFSPEPVVNSVVISYCMNRLPNWLTALFFEWFSRKCSLVLSNVPGPQQKLSIVGNTIESLVFWPPQKGNVGIGVSMISYNGHVRLGVLADTALLTTPHVLVEGFVRNVHTLAETLKLE